MKSTGLSTDVTTKNRFTELDLRDGCLDTTVVTVTFEDNMNQFGKNYYPLATFALYRLMVRSEVIPLLVALLIGGKIALLLTTADLRASSLGVKGLLRILSGIMRLSSKAEN